MITSSDLKVIFVIFYDNNPYGFNQAFANAGYSIPSDRVQAKAYIIKQMYDLYMNNPSKLQAIMDSVVWDSNANNYTTKPNVRERMLAYLKENVQSSSNPNAKLEWSTISGFLFGNHDTVTTQVTNTPVPNSTSTIAIIGYIVLGILAVVLVIVGIRMMRRG